MDCMYIAGLVQDYSNSIADALELLQSCINSYIHPSDRTASPSCLTDVAEPRAMNNLKNNK